MGKYVFAVLPTGYWTKFFVFVSCHHDDTQLHIPTEQVALPIPSMQRVWPVRLELHVHVPLCTIQSHYIACIDQYKILAVLEVLLHTCMLHSISIAHKLCTYLNTV